MKLYIAGPMTGIDDHNRPAFFRMEKLLKRKGYDVINPARTCLGPDATWGQYMRAAMRNFADADGIVLLDGWQRSEGVRLELMWALLFNLPTMDEADAIGLPPRPEVGEGGEK